jgi:hypothetical protein
MKPPLSSNIHAELEPQVSTSGGSTIAMTFSSVSPNMPAPRSSHSWQHSKQPLPSRLAESDEMLTKRELAARLKKTPRCIEQWMAKRYLPYIKIGHTVLFRWKDVLEAFTQRTVR